MPLTVPRFDHAINKLVPALLREREKGKFRFLGATEAPTVELQHQGIRSAIATEIFDVVMVGFQMFHQNAREFVFPMTIERNIGTMLAFVVRNIFANQDHLRTVVGRLVREGKLPAALAAKENPLDFLVHDGGARSLVDAAYRFARMSPEHMWYCSEREIPIISAAMLRPFFLRHCRRRITLGCGTCSAGWLAPDSMCRAAFRRQFAHRSQAYNNTRSLHFRDR